MDISARSDIEDDGLQCKRAPISFALVTVAFSIFGTTNVGLLLSYFLAKLSIGGAVSLAVQIGAPKLDLHRKRLYGR